MIVTSADRQVRALMNEVGDNAAAVERLGLDHDGLIEAAEARAERLFWAVSDPNQYPGPSTHGALAGAWFHGALCAAISCDAQAPPRARLVGAGDLPEAVHTFEAEANETGDSRATLTRYGLVRAEMQPEFADLAPDRAVLAIRSETGAPDDAVRDLLGAFAIDGAVVVHTAFARVARDPGPPSPHITSALASYRLHRNALDIMHTITRMAGLEPKYM